MLISITCPHCGKTGNVPDTHLGKVIRCLACQKKFIGGRTPPGLAEPLLGHSSKEVRDHSAEPQDTPVKSDNASLGCTIMAVIMGVSLYLLVLSFPVIGSLVRISRGEPLWQTPLALLLVSLTVSISLLGIYACVKMRSDEPKHVRIREIALTLASLATFPGALAGFQFCESGHDN